MQISTMKNHDMHSPVLNNISAKPISKNKCFNSFCKKYPDVNLNMSDSYLFSNNGTTTLNVSPKYIEKSLKDQKAAENLDRLMGLAKSFPQYLSTHDRLPSGTRVSKVSFLVDENGGVSCQCEFEKNDINSFREKKDTYSLSYFEKLKKIREEQVENKQYEKKIQKHQQEYRVYSEMNNNPEINFTNYFK